MADGRSWNPVGAPQTYESISNSADQNFNYKEWELPAGAEAKQRQREVAINLPVSLADQARRIYVQFARSRESPSEDAEGRLYQFAAKSSHLGRL